MHAHSHWIHGEFVFIPGGIYEIGSDESEVERCIGYWRSRLIDGYDGIQLRDWIFKEFPKHKVQVAPFRISRFPVTNRDYGQFLRYTPLEPPESIAAAEPADHPVWGVEYEAAVMYAAWAGECLGRPCRLPSEFEWECAARGISRREYPYGQEFDPQKANTMEAGIGRTTPVDQYPRGVSEFGVFDMAGNVEEWTTSLYTPYGGGTFVEDDLSRLLGKRYRILRGGSFALGGDLTRCARRHGPHPGPLFRYRGFRLVADSLQE